MGADSHRSAPWEQQNRNELIAELQLAARDGAGVLNSRLVTALNDAAEILHKEPVSEIATPKGHDDAKARIEACVREIEIICDSFGYDQSEWLADNEAPPSAIEPTVGVPYLHDRGDGVAGHYCIGRKHPDGYFEFWNKNRWCSAGEVFELGASADGTAKV